MRATTYEEAWSFLDQLQFFKIKLGLDSMNMFMAELDNAHQKFPCIHIGGTNGKGSVGATLLSILSTAGYTVGFYTSPHLSSVRERFRIGDEYISKKEFAGQAEQIIRILNGRQITYFEFTTALAMLWFAEHKVDLAVLEVGMGGRLDATNIVTPLVSVITNVTMDHEQYLGNTIEEIAFEKAGIIKPGIPVVTGATDKALEVISQRAREFDSPIYSLGRDFSGNLAGKGKWAYTGLNSDKLQELPLNMKGEYQVGNASLALAALEVARPSFPVNHEQLNRGLAGVRWPGRLEEFWRNRAGQISLRPVDDKEYCHILLDGAHNPDGAQALRKSLERDFSYDRLILIWAAMADKDILATMKLIVPLADRIIFTKPYEERSARPEALKDLLPAELKGKTLCIDTVKQALDQAMDEYRPGTMICVAGSLYLVGKARHILCGELAGDE